MQTEQTSHGRYTALEKDRVEFLDRGRQCARLTVPFLLPEEGHNSSQKFFTPFQSFGSRAVNNLASKLLLALFPTSAPFFRYSADEADVQAGETENKNLRTELESGLKKREKIAMAELENTPYRAPFFLALKLMIVCGNALIHLGDDDNIRVYRLDSYVVKRDPIGNVLEIVTKEMVDPITLSETIRTEAKIVLNKDKKHEPVCLYTHVIRTVKGWTVHQEINEIKLKSTEGTYPLDDCPWLPLRFSRIDGEDYGRGLVEEYFGDLVSLDGFRQNLTEGAAVMSKIVFLVRKNGQTRLKDIATAENGDVKYGSEDDVTVLQAEGKMRDFSVVRETARDIEVELAKAFLLNSSVQRDAERVTAQEIRYIARELEDTLGGVYTVQTQEFQLPFIKIFTQRLEKKGKLEKMPKGSITPRIVTGLAALGRTDDLDKLLQMVEILKGVPNALARLNESVFIERCATALFIDQEGLIKDDEQIAAEQQQQTMQGIAADTTPKVLQEAAKGMMNAQA
jgi:hypothetical protein